jgi:hypothetical protein
MTLLPFGFEHTESDDQKGPLGTPAVKGPVDTNQENAFQNIVTAAVFMMKTWDVTFHFVASFCLG